MQKDQAYHEDAILYNEEIAKFAENLVLRLKHEEIKSWCASVGKQHRFHAKRHRSALNKILLRQPPEIVEQIADGLDVPPPAEVPEVVPVPAPPTNLVKDEEAGTVSWTEPKDTDQVLSDGCVKFHHPTEPNCEFNPLKGGGAVNA